MSAGRANLLIEKGTDFLKTFTIRDKQTKILTDLTGSIVSFKVAKKQGGTTIFTIPTSITGLGVITASIDITQIATIQIPEGWYTLNITWSNGETERLVEGRVIISSGVI